VEGGGGQEEASGRADMGPADVREGVAYAQEDAGRLLEDARLLFSRGRFRGAIPPAVLSIEESLKGARLGIAARDGEAETGRLWDDLNRHAYKLVEVPRLIAKEMEEGCMSGARAHFALDGGHARQPARACAVRGARRLMELGGNLQLAKEESKYEGWREGRGWPGLDPRGGEPEALAALVLELASACHGMRHAGTGAALGALAATGATEPRMGGGPGAAGEAVLARLGAGADARPGRQAGAPPPS